MSSAYILKLVRTVLVARKAAQNKIRQTHQVAAFAVFLPHSANKDLQSIDICAEIPYVLMIIRNLFKKQAYRLWRRIACEYGLYWTWVDKQTRFLSQRDPLCLKNSIDGNSYWPIRSGWCSFYKAFWEYLGGWVAALPIFCQKGCVELDKIALRHFGWVSHVC